MLATISSVVKFPLEVNVEDMPTQRSYGTREVPWPVLITYQQEGNMHLGWNGLRLTTDTALAARQLFFQIDCSTKLESKEICVWQPEGPTRARRGESLTCTFLYQSRSMWMWNERSRLVMSSKQFGAPSRYNLPPRRPSSTLSKHGVARKHQISVSANKIDKRLRTILNYITRTYFVPQIPASPSTRQRSTSS